MRRADLKMAPLLVVEKCGKDAGRIEVRETEPIDRSVDADQRRGPHVADKAIIFNRLIAHGRRLWAFKSIRFHECVAQNVREDEKTILEPAHVTGRNQEWQFDQFAKLAAFT